MIDFSKEAMDLKQALAANAYPAADGSADIDNHALPIIEVTLRSIASRRDAEIERLRAALADIRDKAATMKNGGAWAAGIATLCLLDRDDEQAAQEKSNVLG